jgi:hypothetical protein
MLKCLVISLLICFHVYYGEAAFRQIGSYGGKRYYSTTELKVSKCDVFNRYRIHSNQFKLQANWFDAVAICHSFGMRLARFDTDGEQEYLIETVKHPIESHWVAGNDIVDEGTWRWAPDDSPIHVNLTWNPGQPDNHKGSENCMRIDYGTVNYRLNDRPCDDKILFICEK